MQSKTIRLRDFTQGPAMFGSAAGKYILEALNEVVESNPCADVFAISIEGIESIDATFARESVVTVVTLARSLLGHKGVCLIDVRPGRISDNWQYAAFALNQPLTAWRQSDGEVIGPNISTSTKAMVRYVLKKGAVLSSGVAEEFGISLHSASTRLKRLAESGFILRFLTPEPTNRIEYCYAAIR